MVMNKAQSKNVIRSLLLQHPKINPYKIFIPGLFRICTSPIRVNPNFFIIGAAKCGTTSLYDYIVKHPQIISAAQKEILFFDESYHMGILWYKAYFFTYLRKYFSKILQKKKLITGEANPNYIFHPLTSKRISSRFNQAKIIIILRNPVDRAYSDYNMKVRMNIEKMSFEDALKAEESRLDGELEKILSDEKYFSYNMTAYSYLNRGIYVDQIKNWMSLFPKEQFLILRTEDLESQPTKVLKETFEFLDLPNFDIQDLDRKNVGKYKKMNEDTRKWLVEYFKPHNERLYKYLGRDFHWDY